MSKSTFVHRPVVGDEQIFKQGTMYNIGRDIYLCTLSSNVAFEGIRIYASNNGKLGTKLKFFIEEKLSYSEFHGSVTIDSEHNEEEE